MILVTRFSALGTLIRQTESRMFRLESLALFKSMDSFFLLAALAIILHINFAPYILPVQFRSTHITGAE